MTQPAKRQVGGFGIGRHVPNHRPPWTSGHDVQFYESEEFLTGAAVTFLGDGLRVGNHMRVLPSEFDLREDPPHLS